MNVLLIDHYLRRQLRRERLFRDRLHPLDKFDDFELKKLFRFDRNNLIALICSLEKYLQPRAYRNNPMTAAQKVCSCLNYLAGGTYQRTLAALCGVDQSTISRNNWIVLKTILRVHNNSIIAFPADLTETKTSFEAYCRLPNIIGAIDCTHIEIMKPRRRDFPDQYVNRKGWHSINVQAVCDSETYFVDVCAEWPGCVHDSRIFTNSTLFHLMETEDMGILLGDQGYPSLPFLLTPYNNPQSEAHIRYNTAVSRGRVVIERAFGLVKQRFRCLTRAMSLPLRRVCTAIVACFILHNYALRCHDDVPNAEEAEEPHHREQPIQQNVQVVANAARLRQQGYALRNHFTRLFDENA